MNHWIELARARTTNGDELLLRERAGCVELRCNGWELMSNRAHHSEEALAILACEAMPRPRTERGQAASPPPPEPDPLHDSIPQPEAKSPTRTRTTQRSTGHAPHVLIGGLGLGYTLRAALDHLPPTARVTVAELLPEIVALNRGVLAPFAGDPLADPRVSVACTDIAALLRTAPPATFDAILLDTDNGPDSVMLQGNAMLYQPDTLLLIRRALRPTGILAVWSADRSPRFESTLRATGFHSVAHDVPARGVPDDPLHTIYLARAAA